VTDDLVKSGGLAEFSFGIDANYAPVSFDPGLELTKEQPPFFVFI
jgi:hypothetical protein